MPCHFLLRCVKLRRCLVFIAAYLHLSYSLRLFNLVCCSSLLLYLFLLCTALFIFLVSLLPPFTIMWLLNCQVFTLCIIRVMVHLTNHIWRISNPLCALSASWFTLQTIFSKLVIYTVILPWFCWTCMVFQSTLVLSVFCRTWFTLWNLRLVWACGACSGSPQLSYTVQHNMHVIVYHQAK